jgi:hypothetical protein
MAACVQKADIEARRAACMRVNPTAMPKCLVDVIALVPCPEPAPTVDPTRSDITLFGSMCTPEPTTLAPYPPTRPMPNEAAAQTALERLTTQSIGLSAHELVLRQRAARARKIDFTWGFWAGLVLVGVGGTALYLRHR